MDENYALAVIKGPDDHSVASVLEEIRILLETKDLLKATTSLLEEYHSAHDSNVVPATISISEEE